MLVREVQRVPAVEQFDLLAPAFVDDHYLRQEYAGRILTLLNPPCAAPLEEVLRVVLPGWNLSVEQLPRYLARTFGRDAVLHALGALDARGEPGRSKTETIRYWLRLPPGGQSR